MVAEDKGVFLDFCGYISSEDLNRNIVNKMSDCCLAQNKAVWIFFFSLWAKFLAALESTITETTAIPEIVMS